MIDQSSRDKLATALRQYVSGRITNDDLDSIAVDWRDNGAVAVQGRAWGLYDDISQHRAVGKHYLDRSARDEIGRWIVFLHSNLEYTWPNYDFYQTTAPLTNLLTFGWWNRHRQKRFNEFMEAGDYAVWPFVSRSDYDEALRCPRLLAGDKRA